MASSFKFVIRSWEEAKGNGERGFGGITSMHAMLFEEIFEVMFLRNIEFTMSTVSVDVEAKEVIDWARIGAGESGVEYLFELIEGRSAVAGDKLIIDVHREHQKLLATLVHIQTGISMSGHEILAFEPTIKRFVETSRGLPEAIERFAKA